MVDPEGRFPPLPGIDCLAGLQRSAGNAPFYRSLLLDFAARCVGLAHDLEAAVVAGDLTRANILAHGLQGEAGNLGASELARLALLLEAQARHRDTPAVAQALPALLDLLRATAVILQQGLEAMEAEPLAVIPWTETRLQVTRLAISRLSRCLENLEGESVDSFHELLDVGLPLAQSGQLERLQQLIYQFDFGEALKELRLVAEKLPDPQTSC